jgi:hypothetical protein
VGSYQRDGSGTGSLRLSDKDFSFNYGSGNDTISASSIRFDAATGALIAVDGEIASNDTISGTRQAGEAVALGAMPLPIDGTWTLAAGDNAARSCATSLSKAAFGIRCQGVSDLSDWEGPGALALTHVAQAASMFGDLGGTWRGTKVLRDSPESACELRFEGSKVTLTCTKLRLFTGTLSVSFDGNRASGSTDTGLEFAGTRR